MQSLHGSSISLLWLLNDWRLSCMSIEYHNVWTVGSIRREQLSVGGLITPSLLQKECSDLKLIKILLLNGHNNLGDGIGREVVSCSLPRDFNGD